MSLNVAIQMDPIDRINVAGDSSFALLLEAQARGHRLSYYTPEWLSQIGADIFARTQPLRVQDVVGAHATLSEPVRRNLREFDVVLLRQDPPFDLAYITSTHFLERLAPHTLVVNDPVAVRNAPEKLMVTEFPDLMPPTLITRDREEIEAFRERFEATVMKPLYGNGGAAVFKMARRDVNFGSLFDLFSTTFREPWVVQEFLPQVMAGDKRIVLVDGEPLGAVNRVPQGDDIRSNMVRGGRADLAGLTPREREICARIGPELKRRGLVFVGIDVIADWITEINVTSPTGLRAIKRLGGPDLAAAIWDAIERRAAAR
jgi:glutathione synthase